MMFAYRLALSLGIWNVEEWLNRVSSEQLAGWMAYYNLEPWGENRADLRNGVLISSINHMLVGEKSEAKPEQFVLKFGKSKKKPKQKAQSAKEQMENFAAIMEIHAAANGGQHGGGRR